MQFTNQDIIDVVRSCGTEVLYDLGFDYFNDLTLGRTTYYNEWLEKVLFIFDDGRISIVDVEDPLYNHLISTIIPAGFCVSKFDSQVR